MKKTELKNLIAGGEDSRLQFKKDIRNEDSLAAEMVAFFNSEGGHWDVRWICSKIGNLPQYPPSLSITGGIVV